MAWDLSRIVWAITIDGTLQSVDDVHHLVAVDATVDAVFVLDDRDVTLVQQLAHAAADDADEPLTSSPMTRPLEDGDPSATLTTLTSAPWRAQRVGQGRGERRQPAWCRWIRAQDADTHGRAENRCARNRVTSTMETKDGAFKVIPTGG